VPTQDCIKIPAEEAQRIKAGAKYNQIDIQAQTSQSTPT